MNYLRKLSAKQLRGQTVLVRVDLNIEEEELPALRLGLRRGEIPVRLTAILATIQFLRRNGARVVLLSHRGRPRVSQGKVSLSDIKALSLIPLIRILSSLIGVPVRFVGFFSPEVYRGSGGGKAYRPSLEYVLETIAQFPHRSVILLENLRFFSEEDTNNRRFAKQLAQFGSLYVNDAFAVSHRDDTSVSAITRFLPSFAGFLLENELQTLSRVIKAPKHPLVVILGGAKVHDKIGVVDNFYRSADSFLIGGGIANTYFVMEGLPVGGSIYDHDVTMQQLLKRYQNKLITPRDVVTADSDIRDIGLRTIADYVRVIRRAKTIIWNGPMGLIEDKRFRKGTEELAKAILRSRAFCVIGGGETSVAFQEVMRNYQLQNRKNLFISTGGGAMLAYLAGEKLPGIIALGRGRTRTMR